jgi:hypothetical protein
LKHGFNQDFQFVKRFNLMKGLKFAKSVNSGILTVSAELANARSAVVRLGPNYAWQPSDAR